MKRKRPQSQMGDSYLPASFSPLVPDCWICIYVWSYLASSLNTQLLISVGTVCTNRTHFKVCYYTKFLRLIERVCWKPSPTQSRHENRLNCSNVAPKILHPQKNGGYHINPHYGHSFVVVPSWIKSLLKARGAKHHLLLLKKKNHYWRNLFLVLLIQTHLFSSQLCPSCHWNDD